MSTNVTRREWLKSAASVLVLVPLAAITRQACANTNAAVRAQLNYQNTPQGDKSCATCLEFLPGKTDKDLGRCKVIPGDDEISPNGYCIRWNTM